MKHFLSCLVLIIISLLVDSLLYGETTIWNWCLGALSFSFVVYTVIYLFFIFVTIYGGYKGAFSLSEKIYPSRRGERYWMLGATMLILLVLSALGSIYEGYFPVPQLLAMIYMVLLVIKGNKIGKTDKANHSEA